MDIDTRIITMSTSICEECMGTMLRRLMIISLNFYFSWHRMLIVVLYDFSAKSEELLYILQKAYKEKCNDKKI